MSSAGSEHRSHSHSKYHFCWNSYVKNFHRLELSLSKERWLVKVEDAGLSGRFQLFSISATQAFRLKRPRKVRNFCICDLVRTDFQLFSSSVATSAHIDIRNKGFAEIVHIHLRKKRSNEDSHSIKNHSTGRTTRVVVLGDTCSSTLGYQYFSFMARLSKLRIHDFLETRFLLSKTDLGIFSISPSPNNFRSLSFSLSLSRLFISRALFLCPFALSLSCSLSCFVYLFL